MIAHEMLSIKASYSFQNRIEKFWGRLIDFSFALRSNESTLFFLTILVTIDNTHRYDQYEITVRIRVHF